MQPDEINQVTRPFGKRGGLQMTQDVVNASLIASLLDTTNDGMSVLDDDKVNLSHCVHHKDTNVWSMCQSYVRHASGVHIMNFLLCHLLHAKRQKDNHQDKPRTAANIEPQGSTAGYDGHSATQVGQVAS